MFESPKEFQHMNKKLVIFVVLLVAVGLTLGISIYLKRPSIPPGTVFVSGNIEAIEVDLSFRIAGQINSLQIGRASCRERV